MLKKQKSFVFHNTKYDNLVTNVFREENDTTQLFD